MPASAAALWWLAFASLVLAVCKALVFGHGSAPIAANALIFAAVLAAAVELLQANRCLALGVRLAGLRALQEEEAGEKRDAKLRELLDPQRSSLFGYWRIMRPYFWPTGVASKLRVLATFFVLGGSKACNLFSPLYIGAAAQVLSDGRVPYREVGAYCGLRFASSFFSELQKIIYLGVKQHAFAEIAENTFSHLLGLSLDWHLRKKMGEVLRVMDRGITSADSVMNYLVIFLLPSVAECAVTLVLFFVRFDSPELAAVALLSFVAYVFMTVQITIWRKKFRQGQNKQDNKYHELATDSLVNFETVKYFASEAREVAQFKAAVKKFQSYSVGTQASLSLLNASQSLDIQLTTLLSLCIVSTTILHASRDGGVQIGEFVSINAYILQLFTPLSFLGTIYGAVVQAFVDMNNLSGLLTLSPDVRDAPNAAPLQLRDAARGATVEFRQVDFSYPSDRARGLRELSFVAEAGSTTAIVGPTGAGKSTVSRLLFRFYDVDAGAVLVDGQDVRRLTQASLRSAVGVVPQDTVLFNASLEMNIRYGRAAATRDELVDAARRAQILPLIERLEQGWDTVVGERGLRLSGGEKQRVAIARCVLKDPPVVLLDEATSALDSATEAAVQEALRQLGTGRTQLVVAHRLSTIRTAEQILVLDAGRIAERGAHPQLLERQGLYAKLWAAQVT